MPEILETPTKAPAEKLTPASVECFGQMVLTPENVNDLKERMEKTLNSKREGCVYDVVDQLSNLKRAGVRGLSVKLGKGELARERERLDDDPYKLAKYLVRLNYLGAIEKKDIADEEKALIQEHIETELKERDKKNFTELCVNAHNLGIEISQEAKDFIRTDIEVLSRDPHGKNVDTYVKRRAQARYLSIDLKADTRLQAITENRLTEHSMEGTGNRRWEKHARLRALYIRATDEAIPMPEGTQKALVEHVSRIKKDPVRLGRYLGDLKTIEKAMPIDIPVARPVTEATPSVAERKIPPTIPIVESVPPTPREAIPVTKSDMPAEAAASLEKPVEHVNTIVESGLDQPLNVEGLSGPIVCGTDKGFNYSSENQDRIVINTEKNAFGIIDGMGGHGGGEQAAQAMAEALQEGFGSSGSFEEMQQSGHERMQVQGLGEGGVVMVAWRIRNGDLEGVLVGDTRLIVVRGEKVVFTTMDRGAPPPYHNEVSDPITGDSQGKIHPFSFKLEKGDRVIAGSDGIFESVAGYSETFDKNYWQTLHDKHESNDVKEIAESALQMLEGDSSNEDQEIYDHVRGLRGLVSRSDSILQAAGELVLERQNNKVVELTKAKDARTAFGELARQTQKNMESGHGKSDNRSVLIYDIEHFDVPQPESELARKKGGQTTSGEIVTTKTKEEEEFSRMSAKHLTERIRSNIAQLEEYNEPWKDPSRVKLTEHFTDQLYKSTRYLEDLMEAADGNLPPEKEQDLKQQVRVHLDDVGSTESSVKHDWRTQSIAEPSLRLLHENHLLLKELVERIDRTP